MNDLQIAKLDRVRQHAELERVRASQRAPRREPVSCEEPAAPGFFRDVFDAVAEVGVFLLRLVGAAVGLLVTLVTVVVLLVWWANAPTPMWRCTSTISETAHGTTYTYCAD